MSKDPKDQKSQKDTRRRFFLSRTPTNFSDLTETDLIIAGSKDPFNKINEKSLKEVMTRLQNDPDHKDYKMREQEREIKEMIVEQREVKQQDERAKNLEFADDDFNDIFGDGNGIPSTIKNIESQQQTSSSLPLSQVIESSASQFKLNSKKKGIEQNFYDGEIDNDKPEKKAKQTITTPTHRKETKNPQTTTTVTSSTKLRNPNSLEPDPELP